MTCRPRDWPAESAITAPDYAGRILSMGYSNNLDFYFPIPTFRKLTKRRLFRSSENFSAKILLLKSFKSRVIAGEV